MSLVVGVVEKKVHPPPAKEQRESDRDWEEVTTQRLCHPKKT